MGIPVSALGGMLRQVKDGCGTRATLSTVEAVDASH